MIVNSRTEELVENFMVRLAAWIITRTGALNATVTQKQYIVGVDSTALLCTTGTESKMNKFGVILENDVALQTVNIYCADHVLQAKALLPYKTQILSDDGTTSKGFSVKMQCWFSSSVPLLKELGKNLDSVKKFPVIVYRDRSINTMQLRPQCDRSLVVDLFHG